MLEMELLKEAFRQRGERLKELRQERGDVTGGGRASLASRLEDPSLRDGVGRVRAVLDRVPDVRHDRVEEVRRRLREGTLRFDSLAVADSLIQETILNELL